MRRNEAFTLLELVIVISIIGILFMITVPRVTGLQKGAQEKVCAANLRMIAAGAVMYSMQNSGAYPGKLEDMKDFIGSPKCPVKDNTYEIGEARDWSDPICTGDTGNAHGQLSLLASEP